MVDEITFKRELNDVNDELATYHNPNGAQHLFDIFTEKYQTVLTVTDDEDTIHRYLKDAITMTIFNAIDEHDWSVEVEHLKLPISEYYFIKGDLLLAKNANYADILVNYALGLKIEPTNATYAIKLANLAIANKDWSTAKNWMNHAWQYAYQVDDVAAVFDAFATYSYLYQDNQRLAVILLSISLAFKETDGQLEKLGTWNSNLPIPIEDLTEKDFDYVTNQGLPINYNDEIEVALTEFGSTLLEMELIDQAKTLYQDLFALTDDEDYAEILSEL